MASDSELEKEIQAKGLNAPRIKPEDIENVIVGTQYYVFPDTTVTACCLTLKNGFSVVGTSGAASKENFDREIGQKIARDNAVQQIWQLEGYLLREKLSKKEQ